MGRHKTKTGPSKAALDAMKVWCINAYSHKEATDAMKISWYRLRGFITDFYNSALPTGRRNQLNAARWLYREGHITLNEFLEGKENHHG